MITQITDIVDWDSLGTKTIIEIPDGDYLLRADKVEYGTSREGNPKISLEYVIIGDENLSNVRVWDTLAGTPRAVWRFRDLVVAMGLPVPTGKKSIKETFQEYAPHMKGKSVCATLKTTETEYQGVKKRKCQPVKYFQYDEM